MTDLEKTSGAYSPSLSEGRKISLFILNKLIRYRIPFTGLISALQLKISITWLSKKTYEHLTCRACSAMRGGGPDSLERSHQVLNNEINHKTFFEGETFMADMIAAFLD